MNDHTQPRPAAVVTAAALVGSIVLANVITTELGQVPAGFGLLVAAGTYTAALALAFRDVLHEVGGIRWVLAAIATGAVVSYVLADARLAIASAVAFAAAELIDLSVWARLRRRGWRRAVAASNLAGALVDSVVFLGIAGWLTWSGVGGQLLVKAIWVTGLFLVLAEVAHRVRAARRSVNA